MVALQVGDVARPRVPSLLAGLVDPAPSTRTGCAPPAMPSWRAAWSLQYNGCQRRAYLRRHLGSPAMTADFRSLDPKPYTYIYTYIYILTKIDKKTHPQSDTHAHKQVINLGMDRDLYKYTYIYIYVYVYTRTGTGNGSQWQ